MARGRKDYEKAVVAVESEGYTNPHGRILMQDNFEDAPLKWLTGGSGTHFETRQTRAAYNGSYGVELDLTSDLPPAERESRIIRVIPIDVTKRLMFEVFWRANDLANLASLYFIMHFYTGTEFFQGWVAYYTATQRWEYHNDAAGMTPVINGGQTFYNHGWNEFSLAMDFSVGEYILFKSNNLEWNLGRIPFERFGSGVGAHALAWITAYNGTGNQLLLSMDDIIVRELEA